MRGGAGGRMSKHGWSSPRGRARHLLLVPMPVKQGGFAAYCNAPIRFTSLDGFDKYRANRMRALEVCDWCEHARRRAKR